MNICVGSEKSRFFLFLLLRLLAACILRDRLGALADCVFCQLSGKQKANGCLDFSRCDGGFFVVVR